MPIGVVRRLRVNNDLSKHLFSNSAKVASEHFFKKNDRRDIQNYRTVSTLNFFLKSHENL